VARPRAGRHRGRAVHSPLHRKTRRASPDGA
jgi:hypothetical protein